MPKRSLWIGLVLLLVLSSTTAWGVLPIQDDNHEVPLPLEMATPTYTQLTSEEAATALPGWEAFTALRGPDWTVAQYRADLGSPAAIMGPSFELVPAGSDDVVIGEAARDFIAQNRGILNVDPSQLGQPEVIDLYGKRQVLFAQTYRGLEVIGGRAEVYVSEGKLIMMGAEFYPGVDIAITPVLSAEGARDAAVAGMPFDPATDEYTSEPRLVVYPIILDGKPDYYLAYEVVFTTVEPVGLWWAYVDASDGDVLSRINHAAHYDIPTTVRSDVQPLYPQDPEVELPSPDHYVLVNSQTFYTDQNGFVNLSVPNNQSYPVHSELRGRYSNVNRQDGADATWDGTGTPGQPLNIKWDESNSHIAERDAYKSHNEVHSWLKQVDPAFTSLDFMMQCNVNLSGSCNAFWNGGSINFYAAGGGCVNMAQIADVVYHEYGHAITQYTYSPSYPPTTSGMGEAFSDIVANSMINSRYIGKGMYNGNGFIRDAENLRQYPASECGGQVHCLGEVLMGSMWKARKNFVNTYGYSTGVDEYQRIMRAAWKTKQYSMPNYLTRLLMADDNNSNLGDGTPNWYDICDAFAIHNLPCPALTQYIDFTHTQLADQTSTSSPYAVTSLIVPIQCGDLVPSSLKVFYSVNGGQNWSSASMSATGNPNEYRGYIPAQGCGTVVDYYIYAESTTGVTGTDPLRAPTKGVYRFMVGPTTVDLNDNFESDLGWTVGAPGDAATDGIWERVDPVGKTNPYTGEEVQPENDHTPSGTKCYVTNGTGGYYLNYDVDGGATTILSPIYDFSASTGAGNIEFWAFFANEAVINDTLRASISNDGGNSWFDLVYISGMDANAWNWYKAYFSAQNVPFTSQMRFRFQIADYDNSLTEGAVDDIIIRHTVCGATSVDDPVAVPAAFSVEPNRPNPVRGHTNIRFALPEAGEVQVELFDAGGRLVRTIARGSMDAGEHTVTWDGKDENGRAAASGVYYYRVRANGEEQTQKMMVLR